jgi:hypothetical protein
MKKQLPIIIGIIGFILTIAGTFLLPGNSQKVLFLLGSIFLFYSSFLEKHMFFAILEVIVLAGTLIAFAPVSMVLKAGLPIVMSILAIILLISRGMLKDPENILGFIGLLLLAIGYAISNPIVYLISGVLLAIYSYFSYRRGARIALLFMILNSVFAITSAFGIYRLYF